MTFAAPIPISREALEHACVKYRVARLRLFGSAVRGKLRPDSDIDLLVDFQPDAQPGLLAFTGLMLELAELFGRPVDLVEPDALKPRVRAEALSEAVLLYAA